MITEDYCNFETAKLLKEKGFDEPTLWFYVGDGTKLRAHKTLNEDWYRRPTLQMAMKWLRRKGFDIVINVSIYEPGMFVTYEYTFKIIHFNFMAGKTNNEIYSSYEEAAEAAIKYCLENLI